MEFSGSLIIVSHDRDFLANLTEKTVEFKDKKLKEFLGDINYYLEKNNLEMLTQLEESFKNKNSIKKVEIIQSKNQTERLNKKNLQKEEGKAVKKIVKLESEIENLEKQIEEMSLLFQDAKFMSHAALAAEKQIEFENLQINLKIKLSDWEEQSSKLEEIKKQITEAEKIN